MAEGRETHGLPQAGISDEDLTDLEEVLSEEARTGPAPRTLEASPRSALGPSIHGNRSEMSLPTVLAMLELERLAEAPTEPCRCSSQDRHRVAREWGELVRPSR